MPVRDLETFWPVRGDGGPRVLAHRGANGIDGTVAAAYGAAASRLAPVVLVVGDVTLAHDVGGLLDGARLGIPLTIVLVDNDGGAIFDFLPIATQTDVLEQYVSTPTGLDFEQLAATAGARYVPVGTLADLHEGLESAEGTTILHVRTDRAENVAIHRRVWAAVLDSLR